MNGKILNVRIPQNEFDALEIHARRHGRTKSEVVREFLRALERKNERSVSARLVKPVSAKPVSARKPTTTTTKRAKS
jgi:Ribbon-helix-helix protein, copG family